MKEAWKELVHSGRSRTNIKVAGNVLSERKLIMSLSKNNAIESFFPAIDSWDDNKCYYYAMESGCGELFDWINNYHKTEYNYLQKSHGKRTKTNEKSK